MELSIFLFGKPEWEIDLDKATCENIRDLGLDIKERLDNISTVIGKLENNGWSRYAGLYDINYYKEIELEEGMKELESLDINKDRLSIMEDNE